MPSRLYKYQPFTALTLANLKNRTLWFSAPSAFNDPFDCSLTVSQEDLTVEELNHVLNALIRDHPEANGLREKYTRDGAPTAEFKAAVMAGAHGALAGQIRDSYQKRGIACLAEAPDNLLMWGHYADGHRGFVLEFNGEAEPFNTARPVTYSDTWPSANAAHILLDRDAEPILRAMALTKANCWSYEREWRLIHREASTAYTYDWKHLTGVYFGAAMPYVHLEILALVLQGSPTTLYEMKRSDSSFAVTPTPVTYTPFPYR